MEPRQPQAIGPTYRATYLLDDGAPVLVPATAPEKAMLTWVCQGGGCPLVHLELRDVAPSEEGGFSVVGAPSGTDLWFNTETGKLGPDPSREAPWLAEHIGPLEARLRDRWKREQARMDADTWRRFDWASLGPRTTVSRRELFPADWDPTALLDGRQYLADDLYCVNPDCGCTDVTVVFSEVFTDGHLHNIGTLKVDVSKNASHGERFEGELSRRIWAQLKQKEGVANRLAEERERLRAVGAKAIDEGLRTLAGEIETFRRTEPKVGRNAPCPCGSGEKHKRCCLVAR